MGSSALRTWADVAKVLCTVEARVAICPVYLYRGSSCVPFEIFRHIFFFGVWLAHEGTIRASSQPVKETNCAEWGDSFTLSPRR